MEVTRHTGDATLDRVIQSYVDRNTYYDPYAECDRPLTDLMDAENARFMCQDVTEDFLRHAPDARMMRDVDPVRFGFTEQLDIPHTVAAMTDDTGTEWIVCFTAAQYDCDSFPLVMTIS